MAAGAADAAAAGISTSAVEAFNHVVGRPGIRDTRALIYGLNGEHEKRLFYTDAARSLPYAQIVRETSPGGGSVTRYVLQRERGAQEELQRLAGGSYGEVFIGQRSGIVYKEIQSQPHHLESREAAEKFCREVYVEAFIQTLVGADPVVGHSICQLTTLFRSYGFLRRPAGRRKSFSAAPATARSRSRSRSPKRELAVMSGVNTNDVEIQSMSFILEMEKIDTPFTGELRAAIDANPQQQLTVPAVAPVFAEIGKILQRLNHVYAFRHRDLHIGNVMLAKTGSHPGVRLIDFGMACVTIDGVTYSRSKEVCEGWDTWVLLSSLLSIFPFKGVASPYQTKELFDIITSFFRDAANKLQVLKSIAEYHFNHPGSTGKQQSIFHYFYHKFSINKREIDTQNPWKDLYPKVMASDRLQQKRSPAYFEEVWSAHATTTGGRRRTRRRGRGRR